MPVLFLNGVYLKPPVPLSISSISPREGFSVIRKVSLSPSGSVALKVPAVAIPVGGHFDVFGNGRVVLPLMRLMPTVTLSTVTPVLNTGR